MGDRPIRIDLFLNVLVIDARRSDAGLAGPRVDFRTRLARAHVSHARLVPQIAHLRVVAFLRTVLFGDEKEKY